MVSNPSNSNDIARLVTVLTTSDVDLNAEASRLLASGSDLGVNWPAILEIYEAGVVIAGLADVPRPTQVQSLSRFLQTETDFMNAPASSRYHLNSAHGLVTHSVLVMMVALSLRLVLAPQLPASSVALCSLFHDLGKLGSIGAKQAPRYVPNLLKGGGLSESRPFNMNPNRIVMAMGTQSLYIVSKFVDLTEAEAQAITAHDGQYIPDNREYSQNEVPLTLLLHHADMWSGRVLENRLPVDTGFRGAFVGRKA